MEIGKDFTIAIRWIDSHLKTGFVPTMTERFQFLVPTKCRSNFNLTSFEGSRDVAWVDYSV